MDLCGGGGDGRVLCYLFDKLDRPRGALRRVADVRMVAPRNAVVASSADAPAADARRGRAEEGDEVAWVEAGADCAALPNTSWTALRAAGTAAAALAAGEEAYRLCYGFGGGAWPAVLMPGVYLRAAAADGAGGGAASSPATARA